MELITLAAVADNGVIGHDGDLPWPSIPADKAQYRQRTASHPVILGRRTFELMCDDLPGSAQIVLSRRDRVYDVASAHSVSSVDEAIATADKLGTDRAYVLGGAAIYDLFLPHVDRMILSRIPGSYEGDSYFPEWEITDWHLRDQTSYNRFTLEEWVRESD